MKTNKSISGSNSGLGRYLTLLMLTIGVLTVTAQVDAQQRGVRVSDREVERIIRNIEQKSDTFKRSFDPALDRSRLDGTNAENLIHDYVKAFEDATNNLRSRFNGSNAVASDVENVLNRAAVIDQFMRTNLPQRQIQANWVSLRGDLNRLAKAYNVTFDWSGLYLTPTVVAAYRVSDRQVQILLDRIESRADVFRTGLDRALDRSRYNEKDREENVNEFVKDFENSTDELRRKFDGRTSVDMDVSNVLVRAARIDDFMRRNLRRETAAQRDWRNLRGDLNQLAAYYELPFNLDNRRAMPRYFPVTTGIISAESNRSPGNYRLDFTRSGNLRSVAETATRGLNADARMLFVADLSIQGRDDFVPRSGAELTIGQQHRSRSTGFLPKRDGPLCKYLRREIAKRPPSVMWQDSSHRTYAVTT